MTLLSVARRPGTDLLFSLWLALVAAGLVLHILADIFQQRHPGFPLLPVLISAGTSFVAAHCCCMVIARRTVPGFALYQPFVGGDRYIVLQAIGYLGLVFGGAITSFYFVYVFGGGRGMLISSLMHAAPDASPPAPSTARQYSYGLLSASGIILATSTFIILQSMSSFRNPKFAPEGSQRSLLKRLSSPPVRESALLLMISGANVLVCLVGGVFPQLTFLCTTVYLVIHLICGFAVHVVVGWQHTPGYQLFNPFPAGGLTAALAQFFVWLVYASALEGSVLLLRPGAPFVAYIALASAGFLSVTSLLLFIRTRFFEGENFRSATSKKATANSSAVTPTKQQSTSGDEEEESGSEPRGSSTFAAQHGPFMLSITNGLAALFVWSASVIRMFAVSSAPDDDESSLVPLTDGLAVCQAVTAVLMLGLPALTHLLGSVRFPEHYDAWQPFQGPAEFILLQAIGWAFFTTAIVTGIMAISGANVFLDVCALSVLLSQLFIHSSVSVFRPNPPHQPSPLLERHTAAGGRSGGTAGGKPSSDHRVLSPVKGSPVPLLRLSLLGGSDDPATAPTATPAILVLNGEMITAVLLVVSSIIVRVICDVTPRNAEIPVPVLVASATAMWTIAAPLAHISGRDKGIPIFQPFSGPAEYVAMQAVGWTLYAIVLLLQVISVFEGSKDFTPLMYTMEGVVAGLPFAMIAASVYFGYRKVSEGDAMLLPFRPMKLPEPLLDGTYPSTPRSAATRDAFGSSDHFMSSASPNAAPTSADVAELHRLLSKAASPWVAQHLRGLLDDAVFAAAAAQQGRSVHAGWSPATAAAASATTVAKPSSGSSGINDLGKSRAYGAARATCFVMCATSTTLFFLAGDFSTVDRRRTALILAVGGCFCTTMACVALHLVLGPLLGGTSYRAFMPFEGGLGFVAMQACGWSAYTVMIVLTLLYALELTSAMAPLLIAGCLGAVAQVLILLSTRRFSSRTAKDDPPTMLENHAEGAVAVLMFLGTFTFYHSYEAFASGRSSISPFPIVCSCTCLVMAIPLTVRSLRKSSEQWQDTSSSHEQLASTPTIQTPSKRSGGGSAFARASPQLASAGVSHRGLLVRSVVAPPLMMLEYLIFAALSMLPFTALYAAYYVSNDYVRYAGGLLSISSGLLLPGIAVALLLTLVSRSAPSRTPKWFIDCRVTVTTCAMYMIPAIIFVPTYVIGPFFFPTNGTFLWAFCVSWYVCIPPPWNRIVFKPINAGLIAWFLHSRALVNMEDPTSVREWLVTVSDMSIVIFWYNYNSRFAGKPEERGRFRSPWFIDFMKTWFFDDAALYFNLKVVAHPAMRGKLKDPTNQFIFGFHPHGVFPATAMYAPHTAQWQQELGSNPTTYPVGHAATVLMNSPLVRDFVMGLGARVVTRAGIEASLDDGHSPIIVAGGQSELMITSHSHTELHLVTHHFGFIKIAVRRKLPLVPILSIGENNVLDIFHFYRIQRFALKLVGFPAPFCPTGKWHLPLPNRTRLTVVVGAPVEPDPDLSCDDADGIQRLATRYFDALRELFYTHREAAGYPEMELYLHHGLPASAPTKESLAKPASSKTILAEGGAHPEKKAEKYAGRKVDAAAAALHLLSGAEKPAEVGVPKKAAGLKGQKKKS